MCARGVRWGARLTPLARPSCLLLCPVADFESLGFPLPPNENPADFFLDVLAGSVGRQGVAAFHPQDLFALWDAHGRGWTGMHAKLASSAGACGRWLARDSWGSACTSTVLLPPQSPQSRCTCRPPSPCRHADGHQAHAAAGAADAHVQLDPEQLQLLEQAFDEADTDGDGALDAGQLRQLLEGLGLEPAGRDVAAIMAELAAPRTGERWWLGALAAHRAPRRGARAGGGGRRRLRDRGRP